MKLILDECLDGSTARACDAFSHRDGVQFVHVLDFAPAGTDDAEIPDLCKVQPAQALVTVNYKDFGARKRYFEALLAAGVSVVVLRPGKGRFFPSEQVALIARHYPRIRVLLRDADKPILISASQTEVRVRDLDELMNEVDG